jgi:hypothetical protein
MGQRGRACPVCSNPELLPVVTALLEAGTTHAEIAERTAFSKDQIARHRRHSAKTSAPADEPTNELAVSNARLSRWLERSEAAWVAASAQGDTKSAIDALRSGVRAELEHHRRLEKQERTAVAETSADGQPTLESLDALLRETSTQFESCPVCTGWGDNGRIYAFISWLLSKGLSGEFETWAKTTPHTWASSQKKQREHENSRAN